MCFPQGQTHCWSYLLNGFGPINMEQKGNALFGYWVTMTLTLELAFYLDHGFFKVKFEITVSPELLLLLK